MEDYLYAHDAIVLRLAIPRQQAVLFNLISNKLDEEEKAETIYRQSRGVALINK